MAIWKVAPLEKEPEIILESWMVFELADGSRYFAGYSVAGHEGRTSSAIQTFDKSTMKGITRSGRVYQLIGPPGLNGDALYVLGHWLTINQCADEYKDVSQEMISDV